MLSLGTFIIVFVHFSKAICCPSGWTSHGSSCYHFSHDTEAWPDAVTVCQILGGYLVEINDAAENEYLVNQSKLISESFWIGLSDLQEEGTWRWVNSKAPISQGSFSNWSHGQPDNSKSNENCADLAEPYNYLWNDAPCHILVNYICERPAEDAEIVG